MLTSLRRTMLPVDKAKMQVPFADRLKDDLIDKRLPLVAIILVLMAVVFVLDVRTPVGIAIWIGYALPILLTFWLPAFGVILISFASAVLILLGVALSPPGIPTSFAFTNRALGLGLVCLTCFFILRRQVSESTLHASEARLRATLDNALDAVIGADIHGRINRWNPCAEELFGWKREEVMGRTLTETIIPTEYQERHEQGLRRFQRSGVGTILNRRIEMTGRARDGKEFPVELTVIPLNVSGKHEFTAFLRDISERKRAQEQLEHWSQTLERRVSERTEALQLANQKLQELDKVRSAFVSIASHEIRTPLTSTLGYVENMLDGITGPLNDRQARYLKQVKDNTTRLTRLINELLNLTLIEEGHRRLHKTEVTVHEIFQDVLDSLQPLAQIKSITLAAQHQGTPRSFKADKDKVHQALINIVQNAIKFTPDGGVVTLRSEILNDASIRINVHDTGPGLSTEEIPKVFDKFYTGTGLPGQDRGIGLGLAITKSLVELHGGTVSVTSSPSRGSTFCITLPLS
jgi:PAS domain S-box-containing protein